MPTAAPRRVGMSAFNTLLDVPEQLLATHDRLRASGFSVVSVVNARSQIDARIWLGQWARARGRPIILAPETRLEAAIAAYCARLPGGDIASVQRTANPPVLCIPGGFQKALQASVALASRHPRLPIAVACGIAEMVDSLLNPAMPQDLVGAALQGLVPVEEEERHVLHKVAEARQLQPFLRGACEGLVYYMLEARQETRGRFSANARLTSSLNLRRHEVDLLCQEARLVIEIDGPEHNQQARKNMDAKKEKDLEDQGYRVQRFRNQDVIENPIGVWKMIAAQLTSLSNETEHV
jgi:very-short-patch-repair endonuclease